jgi:hypothetical protein
MGTIGKQKEGVAIFLRGISLTQFIGMNSIVTDPVSDQTGCQTVCNGDDTGVNRKDYAAVLDPSSRMRNASPVSPKAEGADEMEFCKSGSN